MAETKEALRAEVPGVCRTYYSQTWYEALNQAGVKASSVLRKEKNVYYPPAICLSAPSFPRVDAESEVVEVSKDSIANVTTTSVNLFEEAERPKAIEKEKKLHSSGGS